MAESEESGQGLDNTHRKSQPGDDSDLKKIQKKNKAASTRAEKAEIARREAELLTKETEGGRASKHKANKNAVWLTTAGGRSTKRQSLTSTSKAGEIIQIFARQFDTQLRGPLDEKAPKSSEKSRSRSKPSKSDHSRHLSSGGSKARKSSSKSRGARQRSDVDESDEEGQLPTRPSSQRRSHHASGRKVALRSQKRPRKKRKADSGAESKSSGSSADSTDSGSQSGSSDNTEITQSGDESESDEDELEGDLYQEAAIVAGDSTRSRDLSQELPEAHDLFNIPDGDVSMSSRSRSSSTAGTVPPTTDEEELRSSSPRQESKRKRSSITDAEDHTSSRAVKRSALPAEYDSEGQSLSTSESPKAVKAASKKAGTAALRFENERPRVKAEGNGHQRLSTKKDVAGLDPSPEVQIVRHGTVKLRLTDQPQLVQAVLREAIDRATEDVIFRKAWPEENARTTYGRDLVIDACRHADLRAKFNCGHLEELRTLLKKDHGVAKLMGNTVTDRLSIVRSSAKTDAADALPYYKLGLGEDCQQRVASLTKDFAFHMPGVWGRDGGNVSIHCCLEVTPSAHCGDLEGMEAKWKGGFPLPAVIEAIKAAYFTGHRSTGKRFAHLFTSGLESKPDEKELPISLLALCLTGIYSCLMEYETGRKEAADFAVNAFLSIYEEFVGILQDLRKNRPVGFHDRMHSLYQAVAESKKASSGSSRANALSVIELS